MIGLADALREWMAAGRPAVLVEVAEARGSTPREAGARMLVGPAAALGTIGGGRLEWEAIEAARGLIVRGEAGTSLDLPLGPALGQCCGGHIRLRLERADAATLRRLEEEERAEAARNPTVLIFGAGHVGKALASALAPLPLSVRWIDERAEEFPDLLPPGVTRIVAARPVDLVAEAPAGAGYLVLTHDHQRDFEIAGAVLDRGDFAYAGLIGSATKRRRFERQYAARGGDPRRLARLTCPIGGDRVSDKRPAVIAALAAAEILTVFAQARAAATDRAARRFGS
ncbi:xanthine dehydrogenase accessory protein XdhC [Azospirillum sp. SYSU D00513]|uniref:xanthine dehydrogenase accessory protein XdhC n=1 Tax=Azospirillum sp. SYSU D00513 TaxID=2812561 RepID=UPI001A959B79|nr:xanthine dehydrogenase accessory protein XdhC [Azospirillum sp. SYSU D00513]